MDQVIERATKALERAYEQRDYSLVEPYMSPDIVIDWSSSRAPVRGVYRGIEGSRQLFESFSEPFSELRRTTRSTRRLGRRVLVEATISARGAESGIETTAGLSGAEIWTLEGDRIVRAELVQ